MITDQNMHLTQKQEKLAREIAYALGESDSMAAHRKLVSLYSEEHLRKCLMKALAYREEDITKSRGAIYTGLVKANARNLRN